MTPETAARKVASGLMRAFNDVSTERRRDIKSGFGAIRAPSGRFFHTGAEFTGAVRQAVDKLSDFVGSYPLDSLRRRIEQIVIKIKDEGVAREVACEELRCRMSAALTKITHLVDWAVIHAVVGVATKRESMAVGACSLYSLDDANVARWGQRLSSGQYDAPSDAAIGVRGWNSETLTGQMVAESRIEAADEDHALSAGRAAVEEALSLIRYGQLYLGYPNEPVPDFGIQTSRVESVISHGICVRRVGFGSMSSQAVESLSGVDIARFAVVPAWKRLNDLVRIPSSERTEMQRRITLALAWTGQAMLTRNLAIRVVNLTTALETLLIRPDEARGKKAKLAERIALFPQAEWLPQHVDATDVENLYSLRSQCLHTGQNDVQSTDVQMAVTAVSKCFFGLLQGDAVDRCATLTEMLNHLHASV